MQPKERLEVKDVIYNEIERIGELTDELQGVREDLAAGEDGEEMVDRLASVERRLRREVDDLDRNNITKFQYEDSIRMAAEEVLDYYEEGDDITEAILETADGMYVYTYEQWQVVQLSDAEPELTGSEQSLSDTISYACYDVVKQDVWEKVEELADEQGIEIY